jgi:hypothetical protein
MSATILPSKVRDTPTLTPRRVLIKMDVERVELKVLRGAVGVFQYEPTVIVEFNDWSEDRSLAGLAEKKKGRRRPGVNAR